MKKIKDKGWEMKKVDFANACTCVRVLRKAVTEREKRTWPPHPYRRTHGRGGCKELNLNYKLKESCILNFGQEGLIIVAILMLCYIGCDANSISCNYKLVSLHDNQDILPSGQTCGIDETGKQVDVS